MASEDRVVHCDGGHAGLGHPRIYINLVGFVCLKFSIKQAIFLQNNLLESGI